MADNFCHTSYYHLSGQAQYLVMLEWHFPWQAQHLVMSECHFSWQGQHLVMLQCHVSWQGQHLVMLQSHFSWQGLGKCHQKWCACHEKWDPNITKCCTCHEKWRSMMMCLLRKVPLQHHQMLRLPKKVTLQHHQWWVMCDVMWDVSCDVWCDVRCDVWCGEMLVSWYWVMCWDVMWVISDVRCEWCDVRGEACGEMWCERWVMWWDVVVLKLRNSEVSQLNFPWQQYEKTWKRKFNVSTDASHTHRQTWRHAVPVCVSLRKPRQVTSSWFRVSQFAWSQRFWNKNCAFQCERPWYEWKFS